jgi:two-component system response regulator
MTGAQMVNPQAILLIEDNADDYEATMRAFRKANLYNPVQWVQSGQGALDFLRHEAGVTQPVPGIILLDLNMPGMDGRQTLQKIKGDLSLNRIPVIILTTSNDERDVDACYRMGANTYVQKPVSFDGLIEAIRRLKEYWFEIALLPKENGHD